MTKLYSWTTNWCFPRVGDGGGEVGGPGEISVVREQFFIQVAVAVTQIYTCEQMTWD